MLGMPRDLTRRIRIYLGKLGVYAYAERESAKERAILASDRAFHECASVDTEPEAVRVREKLCLSGVGAFYIPGLTIPTEEDLERIGSQIETVYQSMNKETGELRR